MDEAVVAAGLVKDFGSTKALDGLDVTLPAASGGVERIVQIELNAEEKAMLEKSAKSVQGIVDVVKKAAG